jgi:mannosyltransferase
VSSIANKLNESRVSSRLFELSRTTSVHLLALGGITLLALVLRMYKLGEWSFWIDEVYTIQRVQNVLASFSFNTPISLWLITATMEIFGNSDWSARLAPALIGVISIPLIYFPVRKLFDPGVAILSALFLTLSPWHIHWSQNARFYTALMLFYFFSTLAFYFWFEKNRFAYLAAGTLLLGLAILERWMAFFIVPIIGVYLLALKFLPYETPAGVNRKNILLLVIPGFLFFFSQVYLTIFSASNSFFEIFFAHFIGYQHNPVRVLFSVIYDVGLPLFILALAGGIYLISQKSRIGLYLFIGFTIPVMVLVLIAPFTQTFSRYVFIALPSWVILGAFVVNEIIVKTPKQVKLLAVGVLILVLSDAASQNLLYYEFQNGNRENWKGALMLVEQQRTESDLLVTTRPELVKYYLGTQAIDSQTIELSEIAESNRIVWFIIDNRTHVSSRLQRWLDESTELISVHDVNMAGKTMMLRVYRLSPSIH